jgi:hypothetical protein
MRKKVKKKIVKPNWHKIIALSAAGNYIHRELHEELLKLNPSESQKNIKSI